MNSTGPDKLSVGLLDMDLALADVHVEHGFRPDVR
jgi:hypothetical protein